MAGDLVWGSPFPEPLFFESPHWDAKTREAFHRLRVGAPHREDHLWIASSGSSALGARGLKLIALSREAMVASARAVNEHLAVRREDRWLKPLPSYHVGGLGILARAACAGIEVHEISSWSVSEFVKVATERAITLTSLVPVQVFDLVTAGVRCPQSIRAIVVGGAALAPDLYARARVLGWPLVPSFGMTETCSQIATASLASLTHEPSAFPALTILSHCACRVDAEGILSVRAESLFSGQVEERDNGVCFVDPKIDGWFSTNDRALLPEDGTIVPLGRSDEVVKILGEQVQLQKIRAEWERVVRECGAGNLVTCVIDIPDERRGHLLLAVVEGDVTQEVTERMEALMRSYNGGRNPVERVARWVRVDVIPRTELRKVRWSTLRQML